MWFRAILIGLLIGFIFIAVSIKAGDGPDGKEEIEVGEKLEKIIQNQEQMLNYLKFIKNKV